MKKVFSDIALKISYIRFCMVVFPVLWLWVMYVLGGCSRIARLWHSGGWNKIGIALGAMVVVLMIICIVGLRLEWKIPKFSWKEYRIQFAERYHLNRVDLLVLIVTIIVCGGGRFAGYDWGITSIFQPDEGKLVRPAIDMVISGCPYQNNFYYPSQILSKFAAFITFVYGKYAGVEISYTFLPAYFIFRIITAVVGIATIVVCFLVGGYFRKHLGAIFAVLVSVYPYYTLFAKQVTGDVSVLFFLSLTVLFSLRYMEEREPIFLILMTMGAAMATLEKWHGAVGIGYIGFVVLLNDRHIKEILYKGVLAVGLFIAWIFGLCPNMVFNLKTAIVDGFINIAVYDGSEGAPFSQMFANYVRYGIDQCGGVIYTILMIIGLVFVIRHFKKEYMILLIGILKVLILCLLNRQFIRWGLELFFCQLFLASMGMWLLINKLRKGLIIWSCMLVLVVLEFASGSMVYVVFAICSKNDTRLIQENECIAAGITPNNSVSAYYTGFSPGGINSKLGVDLRQSLSEHFLFNDGEFYKNTENIEYAIINLSDNREPEMVEAIQREGVLLFSYDAKYSDIFRRAIPENGRTYLNDLMLIWQNMSSARELYGGALIGNDIQVYDVSQIPLIFD